MSLPPGPTQPSFLWLWRWLWRPHEFLDECRQRYGETFTLRIAGLPPQVVFSSPEDIRAIFSASSDDLHAGQFNAGLRPLLGHHSLLFADGDEHLRQRRLLLPPFHGERMHAYGRHILEIASASVDAWPIHTPFPIHRALQAITMDVIVRAIFGLEDTARRLRMGTALMEMLRLGTNPLLMIPFLRRDLGPLSPWGRFLRKVEEGDRVLFDEIGRRRAEPLDRKDDVLSLLLELRDEEGRSLTDWQLRDHLVTLVAAGHETTATSLSWALRWILADSSLVDRLREEVSASQQDGTLVPEAIAALPRLDSVVRETLRLEPVFPLIGRIVQRPMELGGHTLDRGTAVLCSIYLAHRREAVYPRPASFEPERFLTLKPSPYEWIPFGGGIRRCIGMGFALYQMKMVLAAVLSRASLRLASRRPIRAVRRSITLVPSEGLSVVLEARRGARVT